MQMMYFTSRAGLFSLDTSSKTEIIMNHEVMVDQPVTQPPVIKNNCSK